MNPYYGNGILLPPAPEGQAIHKKAKNGNIDDLWMNMKWGGTIILISDLEKSKKYNIDESIKGMQRIGFYCHVKFLDIENIEGHFSTSESTVKRSGSSPYNISHA